MKNFKLLVSTPRYNEKSARAELWFTLLICGDKYPIISNLELRGLITAFTKLDVFEVINQIKALLKNDPNFFTYVLKLVPIQYVCDTDLGLIKETVKNHYKSRINPVDSFRIKLNRRDNKFIERDVLIDEVASIFDNPVDLENPDKILRIELLDTICGISFLEKGDVISPKSADKN
jgi:tRNA acetyltransferase TAN1